MRARGHQAGARASGAGNQVVLFGAAPAATASAGSRCWRARRSTTRSRRKRPERAGRRPVRREGAHRVLPGDLRGGPRRRHPGPRRRRAVLRDLGAGVAGDGGMHVWLDRVPLRDATLRPEEILMSESQERMCAVVEPGQARRVPGDLRQVGRRGDRHRRGRRQRPADRSSGTARRSSTCRRAPSRTTARSTSGRSPARRGRTRCRPTARTTLPRPATGDELRATLLRLVGSPNLRDKSWVTDQYDRYVLGNTVLAQPEDAGVIRVDEETGLGVALATDGNGRFAQARPVRRRAARAGRGLPQRRRHRCAAAGRHRLPELRLARGPGRDVAVRRGHPRPGRRLPRAGRPGHRRQRQLLQPDRRRRDQPDAGHRRARRDRRRRAGGRRSASPPRATPCCCSATTRDELGGSEWAHVVHGHLGGAPPAVDLAAEKALAEVLVAAAEDGCWSPRARPVRRRAGAGLVEMCLRRGVGARSTARR